MAQTVIPLQQRGFGETMRRDAWWVQPLVTFVILGGFVVYATWAALQGNHYEYGPYLSPFYSPLLFGEGPHSWFGAWPQPGWWPGALPFSAAMLILWAPGGFRFTCYYYRGAYYKAFWADPPSCAVGEPRKKYLGENTFPLVFQNIHRYFLYLALGFLIVLTYDVWVAMWFPIRPPASARSASASAQSCSRSTWFCSPAIRSGATHCAIWWEAGWISSPGGRCRRNCTMRPARSTATTADGPGRACSRSRSLMSTSASARWACSPTGGSSERYETHEHDVLVIGAGGAGLRAAIEASAAGVKVGLLCKSLLGKAHTVMAEGGVAAALANVDERDSWKVHFADTMRGGQYVNNWRMAELHARQAPDRVRELEAWGAVFDRTADGRILQRNFGGHKYPRLAHVGDRTGLEMIRTLQDHGIHHGLDVHMEFTVVSLLLDGGRIAGAFGYERERGRFKAVPRQSGRARDRRDRARLPHHQQQLGGHRGRPRPRLSRRRRAHRHGVRAVPSRPA